jgi:hypothetical protein
MPDSTLSRRSAALLRVDPGNGCFPRRINFTRKLQKNVCVQLTAPSQSGGFYGGLLA